MSDVGGDDQTALYATVPLPKQQPYANISWHITFWQWHYHILHNQIHVNSRIHPHIHMHTHTSRSHQWWLVLDIRGKKTILLFLPKRHKPKHTPKKIPKNKTKNINEITTIGKLMDGQTQFICHISYFIFHITLYTRTYIEKWYMYVILKITLFILFIFFLFDNPLHALIFNNAGYCFHFIANWIKQNGGCVCMCKLNQVKVFCFHFPFCLLCTYVRQYVGPFFTFAATLKCNYFKKKETAFSLFIFAYIPLLI